MVWFSNNKTDLTVCSILRKQLNCQLYGRIPLVRIHNNDHNDIIYSITEHYFLIHI